MEGYHLPGSRSVNDWTMGTFGGRGLARRRGEQDGS